MAAANDEVSANMVNLAGSVQESAASIEQMTYSIKEVAKNVEALSSTAEETSSSMNEMDVSIDQVQSNANETARLSEEVAVDAEKGVMMRVVGPVCESSDDFGEHPFSEPLPNIVVIRDAGAYGFVMASEYNGRGLPVEIFLEQGRIATIHESRSRQAWAASRIF